MLLHSNLNTYLSENCSGDVCILSAVQWINENAQAYISKSAPVRDAKKENVSIQSKETFTRLCTLKRDVLKNNTHHVLMVFWHKMCSF